MSIIKLSTYTDINGSPTPSSGILLGLDLDGVLKQKDENGNVSIIGSGGGSGTSGTSGTSGISGSSGTSGLSSKGYAGPTTFPSLIDNNNGSVTVGSGSCILYSNENYIGQPQIYEFDERTLSIYDNSINYIYVGGTLSTSLICTTDIEEISQSSEQILYTIYVENNSVVYKLKWDDYSNGLSEKIHNRLIKIGKFEREAYGGLILSSTGTQSVNISEGSVWYGTIRKTLPAFDSYEDELIKMYHSGSGWSASNTNVFDNSNYDDGGNLILLTDDHYTINWVYRMISDDVNQKSIIVLSNEEYSDLKSAKVGQQPILPEVVQKMGMLVGRIIVKKGETEGVVESSFSDIFLTESGGSDNNVLFVDESMLSVYQNDCVASGHRSFAIGQGTTASSSYSYTEGYQTIASEWAAHAEGERTIASGVRSHAEGHQTIASNFDSHAEGYNTLSSGQCSHTEGANTTASGGISHAEGQQTIASGEISHAEGYQTTASGDYGSHAEGSNTIASGVCSHAEGSLSKSSGNFSHAEGVSTTTSGYYSHAEGILSEAYLTGMYAKKSHSDGPGQYGNVTLYALTEDDTKTNFKIDDASSIFIPANTVYNFRVQGLGVSDDGTTAAYNITGIAKNIGGTISVSGVNVDTIVDEFTITGMNAEADNVNGALVITTKGKEATSISWTAFVEWIELTIPK